MIVAGARPAALSAYLSTCRSRALEPGVFDCALFVADWVRLCTGRDIADGYRGAYASVAAGHRLLQRGGLRDLVDMANAQLSRIAGPAWALTGDVAILIERGHNAAGIVANGNIHVLAPAGGLTHVPLARAVAVFRP